MNGSTHTIKRAIMAFGLTAVLATFVVSSALASGGNSPPISYTAANSTHSGGSAAFIERHLNHEDSLSTKANTLSQCPCNSGLPDATASKREVQASVHTATSSQCPCNVGPVGGSAALIPAAGSSTPVNHQSGGFNWGAAGIGTGAGLALIALVGTLAARTANDPITKRRRLARALERAARPERPFVGRGPRYLVQPGVTVACARSLRAIAAALRDETNAVEDASLKAVERFLTDGSGPFFGSDSTAALREAVRVQHTVIGMETADFDEEPVAIAV